MLVYPRSVVRRRLNVIGLFLLIISPVVFLATHGYLRTHRDLTSKMMAKRQSVAHLAALTLESQMEGVINLGLSVTNNPRFKSLLYQGDWFRALDHAKYIPDDFNHIEGVYIFDSKGVLRAGQPANTELLGKSFAQRDWFQFVKEKNKPYLSKIYQTTGPKSQAVTACAIPVKDKYGPLVGILLLRIPVQALVEWAGHVDVTSSGNVYFVDQDGQSAFRPDFPPSPLLGDLTSSKPVREALGGWRGVTLIRAPAAKNDLVVAHEPISRYGWAVLVEQPARQVFKERNKALSFLLMFYGALVLLGGLLSYGILMLFRTLQKNKEELTEFIDHMSTMCVRVAPDGRVLMTNHIAEIASGLSREALQNTNFLEGPWWTFDPEVQRRVKQNFESVLQGKKVQYDERLLFAGIEPVHISFSMAPVMDGNGKIRYILAEGRDITPLKRAQEALAHAQQVARLGNWEWDTVTHKLTWSSAFAKMLNLSEHESEMEWDDFSTRHPEEATFLLERMKKCSEKHEAFSCNRLLHLDNGLLRWVRWTGEAFFDNANKMTRMAGTIQDITAFKMAEEQRLQLIEEQQRRALAEKDQQRSQFLAQSALLLSSSLDYEATIQRLARLLTIRFADWCVLYLIQGEKKELYRAFATQDRLTRGEDENMPGAERLYWSEVGEPVLLTIRNEKSELIGDVSETIRTGFARDTVHGELARVHGFKTAMIVPLIVRGRTLGAIEFVRGRPDLPYTQDDLVLAEELSHYAAVAVENAKLYTEAIRARERVNTLAAIVESSEDAIIGKNLEGVVTSWNTGAEKMYGYTASEMVGRPISLLSPPERLNEITALLERVKRGGSTDHVETIRLRKDKTPIHVSLMVSPIRNEAGDVIGASSISRNISEKKRYEEDLARARDMAIESARMKSEFVANVSHEIRTPMNAIIGMMSLLLGSKLSQKQRDYAETVRASSETLLTIINDILDFSKIEAGKMRLEIQDFDLQSVFDNAIEFLAPRAHFKGLELLSMTAHDVPTALRGDPGRITQLLMNLVGNAIKFTEQGEVVLRISKIEERENAATIRVAVTDTGIGIPRERQKHLFQPFSQVDNSVSRRHGGTGLGLALSKRLVELMGGEIGLYSEPGQGSTFWFQLTLEKQAVLPAPVEEHPSLATQRILVTSASQSVRETTAHMISAWSPAAMEQAETGDEVLGRLVQAANENHPYTAVLIDRNLAREDGVLLAKRIKSLNRIPRPRIILLTTVDQPLDTELGRENGVVTTLIKPFKASALLASLTQSAATPKTPQAPRVRARPNGHRRPKKRPHVLVVEDNSINQRVMLLQLEQLGYTADGVANGLEAVKAWEQIPYDMILMDCQMPEMDGYTATETIRRREGQGRHVPIIAMTAHVMVGDREKCLASGMDDYIPKPIKTENLDAILSKWHSPGRAESTDTATRSSDALNDPSFVRQVSELFVVQTPIHIRAMKNALKTKDAQAIKNEAHSLAGSCVIVGTKEIKTLCRKIEDVVQNGKLAAVGDLLKQLQSEFQTVEKQFSADKKKNRPATDSSIRES